MNTVTCKISVKLPLLQNVKYWHSQLIVIAPWFPEVTHNHYAWQVLHMLAVKITGSKFTLILTIGIVEGSKETKNACYYSA